MALQLPPLTDGEVTLLNREIDHIPYAPNSRQRIKIRIRPDMLKYLMLHLWVQFEAIEEPDYLLPDAPWNFIERITVSTPRGEILKDIHARQLDILNTLEFGAWRYATFPNAISLGPVYTAVADLIIPFENHTGINPEQTILNTNEFTELYLELQYNDPATIWYLGGIVISSIPVISVVSLERLDINLSDRTTPRKKLVDLSTYDLIESEQHQILLPENTKIKTIMVTTYDYSAAEIPYRANGILEYLRIEDDDNARNLRSLRATQIQSMNKQYYHTEQAAASLGSTTTNPQQGVYCIEFDQLHDLASCYDTVDLNYPKLILDFAAGLEDCYYGVFIRQVTTPPALILK